MPNIELNDDVISLLKQGISTEGKGKAKFKRILGSIEQQPGSSFSGSKKRRKVFQDASTFHPDDLEMVTALSEFVSKRPDAADLGASKFYEWLKNRDLYVAKEIINSDRRRAILGSPVGEIVRPYKALGKVGKGSGTVRPQTYRQNFEYGYIETNGINPPISATFYLCDVFTAAVKCFGTDDPGGFLKAAEDEIYLIITAFNPANIFSDDSAQVVKTWLSPVFGGISSKEIFCENNPVFSNFTIGRQGLFLKVAVLDQEHGDPETVRRGIEDLAKAAFNDLKSVAGALTGTDVQKALDQQDLESSILDAVGKVTLGALTDLFMDNKIDEKMWHIPAQILRSWVEEGTLAASQVAYPPDELPSHIASNFPYENIFDPTWLFSNGDASYKVYLRITPYKATIG